MEPLELQHDASAIPVRRIGRRWRRVTVFVAAQLKTYRFWRVSCFVAVCFFFAGLVAGVENLNNPIYALGRNESLTLGNASTVLPATGTPTSLAFIDALFMALSVLTDTGLQTVDFSLWLLSSQILWMMLMHVRLFLQRILLSS
jgi:hypothetical protein